MFRFPVKLSSSLVLNTMLLLSHIASSASQSNSTLPSASTNATDNAEDVKGTVDLVIYTTCLFYIVFTIGLCIAIGTQSRATQRKWCPLFFEQPEEVEEAPKSESDTTETSESNAPNQTRWVAIDQRVNALKERIQVAKHTGRFSHRIAHIEERLNEINLPQSFIDPISLEILKKPAVTDDGHSYNKNDLKKLRSDHANTPLDQTKKVVHIIPNFNLDLEIRQFLDHAEQLLEQLEKKCRAIEKHMKGPTEVQTSSQASDLRP